VLVHHHIGGLERLLIFARMYILVHHHIGGLENIRHPV
jgi:hypothetical protein